MTFEDSLPTQTIHTRRAAFYSTSGLAMSPSYCSPWGDMVPQPLQPPAAAGSLLPERWQEAAGGRGNALLHSLGKLRISSFTAIADEFCCNRNRSQQQALDSRCAKAACLHEKKQSSPQNTNCNSCAQGHGHASLLLWDWQPLSSSASLPVTELRDGDADV